MYTKSSLYNIYSAHSNIMYTYEHMTQKYKCIQGTEKKNGKGNTNTFNIL